MSSVANPAHLTPLKPAYTLQPSSKTDIYNPYRLSTISQTVDGASSDNKSLQSFATAKSQQAVGESPFFKLPFEINFQILSYLSYPEARALNNTCRFFRMYITADELLRYRNLWATELLTLDIAGVYRYGYKKPCYACIRLRPNNAFPTRGAAAIGQFDSGPRLSERKCVECLKKTQKKGEVIWDGDKAWTKCNWCGRGANAYRYIENNHSAKQRRGLCGLCGRVQHFGYIWPVILLHLAELAVSLCCITWASWGSVEGWLVGNPDDKDWDKGENVRIFVIIPFFQLFLTLAYTLSWHSLSQRAGLAPTMAFINFYYAVFAWSWALAQTSSLNPAADPREYQLKVFALAGGSSALGLSFIRVLLGFCLKTSLLF